MSIGFDAAISGLQAARAAIQTIGHNIANQATPGYSRQTVVLQSARPVEIAGLIFGNGVTIGNITRSVDELLLGRARTQQSLFGSYDVQYSRLSELESIMQEPGDTGISGMMSAFFSSVQQLSSEPTNGEKRSGVLIKARALADNFNRIANQIFNQRQEIDNQLDTLVQSANRLSSRIATLNGQILSYEGGTDLRANDLRDQRDQALSDLSNLLSINSIEDSSGAVRVQLSGFLLVSNTDSAPLEIERSSTGAPSLQFVGGSQTVLSPAGKIGGLINIITNGKSSALTSGLDAVAKNFILGVNRHHSTSIPKSGSFSSITSYYTAADTNNNDDLSDESLNNVNFPFEVQDGEFYINLINQSTGAITKHRIEVDADNDTLQTIANKINQVSGLLASVDDVGHFQINAITGYKFDFSPRLDVNPDNYGTFGGTHAAVSSLGDEPFTLTNGMTLSIDVDGGGAQTITFNTADFADISNATTDEIVAKINATLTGANAINVNGRLVIKADSEGTSSTIELGGSSTTALGVSTTLRSGTDAGVSVELSGSYNGSTNDAYTFRPSANGTIGTGTLTVDVLDSAGNVIRTLNVGDGYVPGTEIEIANGVKVKFSTGDINATAGDFLTFDVVADSDTADFLPALGINSLFHGNSASDIQLNTEIELNSDLLGNSSNGDVGGNGALQKILALQTLALDELDGKTINTFYGSKISQLGFDVESSAQLLSTQQFLVDNLEQQRQSVSGVSVDEEMTQLLQFQQMFEAISRYVSTLADLERGLVQNL